MDSIKNIEQLEDILSEPTEGVVKTLGKLEGDIIVLGAGGKMGPTLTRMARRASDAAGARRSVIGVDLFPSENQESRLRSFGIETVKCNLLDRDELGKLPDAANVVFMAGMKFGSTGQESLTWAMNSFLPGMVAERFRNSRIAAFSTGNVYGMVSAAADGGSVETDALNPIGEYAMSTMGRERIFEHFSRTLGIPMTLIRLNYAHEMRYGVLVDLAKKVLAGEVIDLSMGYVNAIWQGDASAMALGALGHTASPPFVLNVVGPELLSIREVAEKFGSLMGKSVEFSGMEALDAFLSNGRKSFDLFGYPRVSAEQLIRWIADWVIRGGESLDKPTHFESRNGKY